MPLRGLVARLLYKVTGCGHGAAMTAVPNAIPTRYAGCHFRSRLEARWAVFFDAMGIPWQYEPQGFEVTWRTSGWRRNYLPDFYLPFVGRSGLWAEVRGSEATLDRQLLLAATVPYGGLPKNPWGEPVEDPWYAGDRLVILGPMPHPSALMWRLSLLNVWEGEVWVDQVRFDQGRLHPLERRHKAARFGDAVSGLNVPSPKLLEDAHPREGHIPSGEDCWRWWKPYAPDAGAFEAARSARFEHGQCGAT